MRAELVEPQIQLQLLERKLGQGGGQARASSLSRARPLCTELFRWHLRCSILHCGFGLFALCRMFCRKCCGKRHKCLAAHGTQMVCISHSGSLCLSGVSVEEVDVPDRSCSPEQKTDSDWWFTSLGFKRNGAQSSREGHGRAFRRILESQKPAGPASCPPGSAPVPEGQLGDGSGQGLGPLIASEGRGIAWPASSEWTAAQCIEDMRSKYSQQAWRKHHILVHKRSQKLQP